MMVEDIDELSLAGFVTTVDVENETVRAVVDLIRAALSVGAQARHAAISRLDNGEGEGLKGRRQDVEIEEGIDFLRFTGIPEEVDAIDATACLRRAAYKTFSQGLAPAMAQCRSG
jgi:hypothetical protein